MKVLRMFFIVCLLLSKFAINAGPIEKYLKDTSIIFKKSGLTRVNCIYVINLDERVDKWDRVFSLFNNFGVKCNRFSAINGWRIPQEAKKELFGPNPIRIVGGHLGCLLSHLSVLKDAQKRNWNVIWVCEDDIEILQDIKKIPKLLKKLNKMDSKWDLFFTDIDIKNSKRERVPSVCFDFRPDQDFKDKSYFLKRVKLTPDIMKIGQRFGMHSVLISKRGINKILNYYKDKYLWSHIDIEIHYIPGIRSYSTTRDIVSVWTNSKISDTNNEI